jgi:hypothetical protein
MNTDEVLVGEVAAPAAQGSVLAAPAAQGSVLAAVQAAVIPVAAVILVAAAAVKRGMTALSAETKHSV